MYSRLQARADRERQIGTNTASFLTALLLTATTAAGESFAQGTAQPQPVNKATRMRAAQARVESRYSAMGYHHANQLPTNFPVPPYPNNVVMTNFISTTKGKPAASATIVTKDPPSNVFAFYQSACVKAKFMVMAHKPKGTGKLGKADRFYSLTARKDKQELVILCLQHPKSQGTLVSMSWSLRR